MTADREAQVNRVEAVLRQHQVPARVWQVKVRPPFVQFDISTAFSKRLGAIPNLADELAAALGARSARVYRSGGVLHVEAQEADRFISLPDLCGRLGDVPPFAGVLGCAETGAPLLVRFSAADCAHLLIAGAANCGKTTLLRTVLVSLAMHNHPGMLQLVLIDPRGRGLGPLGALPHVWRSTGVVQEPAAAVDLLDALVDERQRRAALNRRLPRIVVGIDAWADLRDALKCSRRDPVQRLLEAGFASGIHVIATHQAPAEVIARKFPLRCVGQVPTTADAQAASGVPGSGAEKLLGRGDFVLLANGQTLRFQAAYADARELAGLVATVRCSRRRRRQWAPEGQQP